MTYKDYLADPTARQAMELAVRSARARAVQQYLFAPVVRFCGRLNALRFTNAGLLCQSRFLRGMLSLPPLDQFLVRQFARKLARDRRCVVHLRWW